MPPPAAGTTASKAAFIASYLAASILVPCLPASG